MIDHEEVSNSPHHRRMSDVRVHLRRRFNSGETKATDKMKRKLVSFWNNVKYGWDVKPKSNFERKKPIFLLSHCYDCREDSDEPMEIKLRKFQQDFSSLLWFTYRQSFSQISDSKLTSDGGWGCMLRSAQMMVAQGLTVHFLTREWNFFTDKVSCSCLYCC